MTPKALDKLCREHEGLVKRVVARHRRQWQLTGLPIEDHMQIGRMALVLAAKTWKAGKGSSFPTWAHDAIRWELQKYDKVGSATRHNLRAEQVKQIRDKVARGEDPPTAKSLGVQERDLEAVLEPPEQFVEYEDDPHKTHRGQSRGLANGLSMTELRLAIDELSLEDKSIVQALALGMTPNQVAKKLKKPLEYVTNALERIRAALS